MSAIISMKIFGLDFITISTIAVGLTVFVYFLKQKRYNLPPGPWGWPVIGNIPQFMAPGLQLQDVFTDWSKKYGSAFMIQIGCWRVVILNKLDVIKEALVNKQDAFAGRPKMPSAMMFTENGKDILFGDFGPVWKFHRKVAHMAMRNYAVEMNLEKLVHHSGSIVFKDLQKDIKENGAVAIKKYMVLFTLNTGMGMAFGKHYDSQDPVFLKFKDITAEFTEAMGNGFPEDFIPIAKYFPSKKRALVTQMTKDFLQDIYDEYDDHKKKFDPNNVNDLCDHLLMAQQKAVEENRGKAEVLTDKHLALTIMDVFGAGLDTITYTLMWLVLHMAQNIEIQEKMQEEIDRVVGKGNLPTQAMKPELQYTEAVLYESMRMVSIAPVALPHTTTCDTTVGGYDVPKDTMVMVNIGAVHHDPEIWSDPETFNPERFRDENGRTYRPDGFIPFSAGRRVCLGEQLAKNELLLMVPMLFGKFKFMPADGKKCEMELEEGTFMQLAKDVKLDVEIRC